MARIRFPAGATHGPPRYRWSLHVLVLLLTIGAVLFAVRERLTGDSETTAGRGTPTPERPAAVPPSSPPPAEQPAPTPSPSPSPSPSAAPSPSPTPAPEPTPTPAPLPTPEPTAEPTPVPAAPPSPTARPLPTPTPRPAAVLARAIDVASLRSAPSTEAAIVGYVPAGATVSVIGCAGGCSWLQVTTAVGTVWSARYLWAVTGDLSALGGR